MASPKPKKQTAVDPRIAIVDEIGELEALFAPLKPKQSRLDALRLALKASYDDSPNGESFLAEGKRYTAIVGERGDQTIIDTPKLYRILGWEKFLVLANVTVKALWALPAEVQAECKSTSLHTGPRSLKIHAKVKAA